MHTKVPDCLNLCNETEFVLIFLISSGEGDLFLHRYRAESPEMVAETVERRQGCEETKQYTEAPLEN